MSACYIKHCAHCGSRYPYLASGDGCDAPLNDPSWCPDCKKAIRAALAPIPRLFELRYRDVLEMPKEFPGVTLENVLAWEQANLLDARARGGLFPMRRIFPGLIEAEDAQNVREVVGPDKQRYMVATWHKRPDYEIRVLWEWDLKKGTWGYYPG